MPTVPSVVGEWLRRHHGVISSATLRRLRISTGVRDALVATGVLDVVHEGVYRLHLWPDTFESRCAALCAADKSLAITCASGGRLWSFRTCPSAEIHAITTRTTRPVIAGAVVHRCPKLPRSHVVRRADGIRVVIAARVCFDEAKHRDALGLESLIEDAINQGRTTVQRLYDMGREMCRQGRAGSARFADVLESRPAWRRPADSHPEVVLRDALARAGVQLDTQVPLRLRDGRTIHPDLGRASIAFFVEVDDPTWHGGRLAGRRDRERDRLAGLDGARIERVTTDEIADNLDAVVAQLLEAMGQQEQAMSARAS
jgi:hypothetical protein